MNLREVRDTLGRRLEAAHFLNEATVVTKNGEPRGVLVSYAWYQRHKDCEGPAASEER